MTLIYLYSYYRRGGMNRRDATRKALSVFTRSY
jgi:hypothetical protein